MMELWEIEHVQKNLPKLVKFTQCNSSLKASLLSTGTLSDEEVCMLTSTGLTKGNYEEAFQLYSIIQTKKNGYELLLKALQASRQTGAYEILNDGISLKRIRDIEHNGVIYVDHVLSKEFVWQGETKSIQQVLSSLSEFDIAGILGQENCKKDYEDIFVNRTKKFELLRENIRPAPSPYIPRRYRGYFAVVPEVFKKHSSDVFVFKNFNRTDLSALIEPNFLRSSSSQLLRLTCRHILLEEENHWDEIVSNKGTSEVHLILKHSESTYLLINSTRVNQVIRSNIIKNVEDTPYATFSEDELCRKIVANQIYRGILVCDSPGMGKSWSLENIARSLQRKFSDRLVVFISLSAFSRWAHNNNLHLEQMENCTTLLLKFCCPTNLAFELLIHHCTKSEMKMEIFFDGFDEVDHDMVPWTTAILRRFADHNETNRVYVSSRIQNCSELEDVLGTVAIDLLPFQQDEQVSALVGYWKENCSISQEEKLKTFADQCIRALSRLQSDRNKKILGIPLNCYMVSRTYEKMARKFSSPSSNVEYQLEKDIFLVSICALYSNYIEASLCKGYEMSSSNSSKPSWLKKLYAYHTNRALELLIPELAMEYRNYAGCTNDLNNENIYSCGIMQMTYCSENTEMEFVHRTLAEYLVAKFIVDYWTNKVVYQGRSLGLAVTNAFSGRILKTAVVSKENIYHASNVCDLMSKHINTTEYTFVNNSILSIIDSLLAEERSFNMINANYFFEATQPYFYSIIIALILDDFRNVLNFLRLLAAGSTSPTISNLLVAKSEDIELHNIDLQNQRAENISLYHILYSMGQYSNVEFANEMILFSKSLPKVDLDVACGTIPSWIKTPMHGAIQGENVDMALYFSSKMQLKNRNLLQSLLHDTYKMDVKSMQKRKEICNILLSKNIALLSEDSAFKPMPESHRHPQLLMTLISKYRSIWVLDRLVAFEIINHALEYMNDLELLDLLIFLFPTSTSSNKTKQSLKGNESVEEIMSLLNVVFAKSAISSVPLVHAIGRNMQNVCTAEVFATLGADIQKPDKFLNTPVHYAAARPNLEMLRFLIQNGADVNALNTNGESAFRQALIHLPEQQLLPVTKVFLQSNFDPCQVDYQKDTLAHSLSCRRGLEPTTYDHWVRCMVTAGHGNLWIMQDAEGYTPILRYVKKHEILATTLTYLLENACLDMDIRNQKGENLLLLSIRSCRSRGMLERIVGLGGDICSSDNCKCGVLHKAVLGGNVDAIKYFAEMGIDANLEDSQKCTPIHQLAQVPAWNETFDVIQVVNTLLELGANLAAKDTNGRSVSQKQWKNSTMYGVWVDYLVSLGLDDLLTPGNEMFNADEQEEISSSGTTRPRIRFSRAPIFL